MLFATTYRRGDTKFCLAAGRARPRRVLPHVSAKFTQLVSFYLISLAHPPRGSGEASGTYAVLSTTFSCDPPRRIAVFPMSSPSSPVLQHLCSLDESISDFQDQLCSVLCGEEYAQCVPDLKDKDLMWLVDYLDKVPHYFAIPAHCSNQRRLLIVSILPVPLSGSVYVGLEAYAEPRVYSQHRIHLYLT